MSVPQDYRAYAKWALTDAQMEEGRLKWAAIFDTEEASE